MDNTLRRLITAGMVLDFQVPHILRLQTTIGTLCSAIKKISASVPSKDNLHGDLAQNNQVLDNLLSRLCAVLLLGATTDA